jgi:hypothetical protein
MEPVKKAVARQGLGKYVSAATDAYIIGGDLPDSQIGKTVKYGHESGETRKEEGLCSSNLPDHTAVHFIHELQMSTGSSWVVVRNLHC